MRKLKIVGRDGQTDITPEAVAISTIIALAFALAINAVKTHDWDSFAEYSSPASCNATKLALKP